MDNVLHEVKECFNKVADSGNAILLGGVVGFGSVR